FPFAAAVGTHRGDVSLPMRDQTVRGERVALRDPQAHLPREVFALGDHGVADDPVAVAPTATRAFTHLCRHALGDAIEEPPGRAQELDLAVELLLRHRPLLGARRREGDGPEVGRAGTDPVLDHLEATGAVELLG